ESRACPPWGAVRLKLIYWHRTTHLYAFSFEDMHEFFQFLLRRFYPLGRERTAGIFAEEFMLILGQWCLHRDVPWRKARSVHDANDHFFKQLPLRVGVDRTVSLLCRGCNRLLHYSVQFHGFLIDLKFA